MSFSTAGLRRPEGGETREEAFTLINVKIDRGRGKVGCNNEKGKLLPACSFIRKQKAYSYRLGVQQTNSS